MCYMTYSAPFGGHAWPPPQPYTHSLTHTHTHTHTIHTPPYVHTFSLSLHWKQWIYTDYLYCGQWQKLRPYCIEYFELGWGALFRVSHARHCNVLSNPTGKKTWLLYQHAAEGNKRTIRKRRNAFCFEMKTLRGRDSRDVLWRIKKCKHTKEQANKWKV